MLLVTLFLTVLKLGARGQFNSPLLGDSTFLGNLYLPEYSA